ncbi:c-type cytochrome domain-containing protein [Symmachiella dynata]|uniref:c-type cytochrome domain-containing protein n=1 Tax=Symmachiella dynata TaxID=2527995 RepID=UPI0030ED0748
MWRGAAALLLCAGILVSRTTQGSDGEPQVDYLRDIKPLLKRSCYRCHGAVKQTSGLRLDTARAALRSGDAGEAIVPGKSGESLLYLVVSGSEDYQQMPPAVEGARLTAEEVVLIKRWIDSGAKLPDHEMSDDSGSDHWSIRKPVRPVVPTIKNSAWVRKEIDAFVSALPGRETNLPRSRSESRHPDSPAEFRPDRPAPHAGGGESVSH